jgi:16S rRNA (uracil1498-N3)-methyltransferase
MRSLYVPNLKEGLFNLSEDESRHAVKVLRAKVGFSYTLMNGKGGSAEGEIIEITKNSCLLKVGEISVEDRPLFGLTMIVSPTKKSERFEWFLEKATEIGIERIYPVFTSRSEFKVEKLERWNKILISAMKQSKRKWLPELMPTDQLEKTVTQVRSDVSCGFFIAHCMDGIEGHEKVHLLNALPKGQSAVIAIGPEGDFTIEEVTMMVSHQGSEITLGDMRLRTETAALTAVAFYNAIQVKG